MKANAWHTVREVVTAGWSFKSNDEGGYSNESLQAAALLDIASTLRPINFMLDALGADGLHEVIQTIRKEQRRRSRRKRVRR